MKFIQSTSTEEQILNRLNPEYIQYSEMQPLERSFLNTLVLRHKPKRILELGVSAGSSAVLILNALQEIPGSKLYSIDYSSSLYRDLTKHVGFTVDNYPELKQNWQLLTNGLACKFIDNLEESFDFCFIDTVHKVPGEILDFLLVFPYLKQNAVIVLHDTNLHTINNCYNDLNSNNMLISAISGEKLVPNYDRYLGMRFANIAGVILNEQQQENIWDIFNLLLQPWKYMPSGINLNNIRKYLAQHYTDYFCNFFDRVVNYQISKASCNLNTEILYIPKRAPATHNTAAVTTQELDELPPCVMDIFFAADNNYSQSMCVALTSILVNSRQEENFNFYILDGGIQVENKQKIEEIKNIKSCNIEFITIDGSLFDNCPLVSDCSHISKTTYYRYLIPVLKPEIQKCLYLDCDLVVENSLRDLWDTFLGDNYAAVIEDRDPINNSKRLKTKDYFNAGVMLINNQQWIKNNITEVLFKTTVEMEEQGLIKFVDQDVLNKVFDKRILFIHPKYNLLTCSIFKTKSLNYLNRELEEAQTQPIVIHYASNVKPWIQSCYPPFGQRYFEYLNLTPYRIN
ncbi:MAG: class I SAM-dependent methyltransferase [Deltaproteobacteria bacterium]|jgi:lipopolysaccharide biosynthesis glycosyltransferase/predicted O-methyltransferase YrrM|nr:class I SAM-dependent methyltransferase [Deltaproteobacteria bacterium]